MWPVATDVTHSVVCVSVYVLLTEIVCCANVAEPIEMLLGRLTHVGPRNHVLDGDHDRSNALASTRVDKVAMWHLAELL